MTFGTGAGSVFFCDLRNDTYLQLGSDDVFCLNMSRGWVQAPDDISDVPDEYLETAVYTHSFNEAGTQMFAAGGPIAVGLSGNYAGIWR